MTSMTTSHELLNAAKAVRAGRGGEYLVDWLPDLMERAADELGTQRMVSAEEEAALWRLLGDEDDDQ